MIRRPPRSTLFPTRRSSDLHQMAKRRLPKVAFDFIEGGLEDERGLERNTAAFHKHKLLPRRSEEHTSELQSQSNLVCRLLLEKKKKESNCGNSRKVADTYLK